jgi:raffinose/stachyose/melibiose transport system permease protein
MLACSAFFVTPIFFILINSFKKTDFAQQHFFYLPTADSFVGVQNYISVLTNIDLGYAAAVSILTVIVSVWLILIISSFTAWVICHLGKTFNKLAFCFLLFCLSVPFEIMTFIVPHYLESIGLNNPVGVVLMNIAFGIPLNVFVFVLFIRKIPPLIEEAAFLETGSVLKVFSKIIRPILRPVTLALGVINTVWLWNDFFMPSVVLRSSPYQTFSVFIEKTSSNPATSIGVLSVILLLSLIPTLIFYKRFNSSIIKKILNGRQK